MSALTSSGHPRTGPRSSCPACASFPGLGVPRVWQRVDGSERHMCSERGSGGHSPRDTDTEAGGGRTRGPRSAGQQGIREPSWAVAGGAGSPGRCCLCSGHSQRSLRSLWASWRRPSWSRRAAADSRGAGPGAGASPCFSLDTNTLKTYKPKQSFGTVGPKHPCGLRAKGVDLLSQELRSQPRY